MSWKCLTCSREGAGAPPSRCPSCTSESDERHGPHPIGGVGDEDSILSLMRKIDGDSNKSFVWASIERPGRYPTVMVYSPIPSLCR